MSNQTLELCRWVATDLAAQKYPFDVVYAPERFTRANMDPVVLFQRDNGSSEKVESPKGQQANGRKSATRRVPVKVKVYARSNLVGAGVADHEALADYLVDALIISLDEWSTAQRGGGIEYGEMAFMTPDELMADEHAPEGYIGLVYLMRFTIGRGVIKRTYKQEIRPVGEINGVANTAEVRLKDGDEPAIQPPPEPPPDPDPDP